MKKSPITISNNPVITVKFGSASVGVASPIKKMGNKGFGIGLTPLQPNKDIKTGDNTTSEQDADGPRVILEFTSVKSINIMRVALDRVEKALVNEFLNT